MPQPTAEHLRKRADELRQILRSLADDKAVEVIEAHIQELQMRADELQQEEDRRE